MALPFITVRTRSAEETRSVGRALGEAARPGDVLLLIGELGTGKTTFVQGYAAGVGVTEPVASPSYTIMHTYEGRYPMLHVDLYRLERAQEVVDLGLDDLLDPPWVVAIEWGEKAGPLVTDDFLEVQVLWVDGGDEVRLLQLMPFGKWRTRTGQLTEIVRAWAASATAPGSSQSVGGDASG